MRKTWFLFTWRDKNGIVLRQRKGLGYAGEYSDKFDNQLVNSGETLSWRRLTGHEAARVEDRDFKVLSGAEVWDALYVS